MEDFTDNPDTANYVTDFLKGYWQVTITARASEMQALQNSSVWIG